MNKSFLESVYEISHEIGDPVKVDHDDTQIPRAWVRRAQVTSGKVYYSIYAELSDGTFTTFHDIDSAIVERREDDIKLDFDIDPIS